MIYSPCKTLFSNTWKRLDTELCRLQKAVHLIVEPAWAFQKIYVASSQQVVTVTQHFVIAGMVFATHRKAAQPTVN